MRDKQFHTYLIEVKGLVQGMVFRPFIYRLVTRWDLKAWVRNTNENVLICLKSDEDTVKKFVDDIIVKAPPASEIFSIDQNIISDQTFNAFPGRR